jgi:predicted PurR-regulated permease PerM
VTEDRRIEISPRSLLTFVVFLLGGLLLVAAAYGVRAILVQFLAAVVLAMAMEPPVQGLERRGLSRSRAVGVTFILAVVVVAAFAYLLLQPLANGLATFVGDVPRLLQEITQGQGPFGFLETRFHIVERVREWAADLRTEQSAGLPALQIVGRFNNASVAVASVTFLTFFVALSGYQWFDALLRLLPEESRVRWRRIGRGISGAVGGYVYGNLLISVIAGGFTTALLLATGVPHAVPLGLIVALLDLVPFVGATVGAIIVGIVALTKGVTVMAIVIVAMWVYQLIENNLLAQLVYSQTVKLSPLAIAVSISAGVEVGGVAGALLAIPVAGAFKVIARELLAWRRGEPPPEETEPPKRPWLRRWLERRSSAPSR